jgi:hypothetical protein
MTRAAPRFLGSAEKLRQRLDDIHRLDRLALRERRIRLGQRSPLARRVKTGIARPNGQMRRAADRRARDESAVDREFRVRKLQGLRGSAPQALIDGAGDGIRTRNPELGKLMRYHCATPARDAFAGAAGRIVRDRPVTCRP